MHSLEFILPDDGTTSASLPVKLRLRLYTFDGTLIVDSSRDAELPTLADHREGYFHAGEVQWVVFQEVAQVLPYSGILKCTGEQ